MLGVEAHTLHSLALPALQVEWENVELRGQLLGVTQERDSALLKSRGLQSKLESLEQVLKVRGLCGGGGGPRSLAQGESGTVALCGALGSRPSPGAAGPSLL